VHIFDEAVDPALADADVIVESLEGRAAARREPGADRTERIGRNESLVPDWPRCRLPGHVVDCAADRAVPDISEDGPFRNSTRSRLTVSMTRETKLCGPILIPS